MEQRKKYKITISLLSAIIVLVLTLIMYIVFYSG